MSSFNFGRVDRVKIVKNGRYNCNRSPHPVAIATKEARVRNQERRKKTAQRKKEIATTRAKRLIFGVIPVSLDI